MKKRWLFLAGIILVFACLAIGLLAFLIPQDSSTVTKANFDRIQVGMSRAQVYSILGQDWIPVDGTVRPEEPWSSEIWSRDDGAEARVHFATEFGPGGKGWQVVHMEWTYGSPDTFGEQLLRWLYLRE